MTAAAPASDDADEFARALMTTWLTYFTTPAACPTSRLREFTIEIGSPRYKFSNDVDFVTPVIYSVFPADESAQYRWLIGNGQLGANNWVEGKLVFLTFRHEGNTLIIEQMPTAPPKLPTETAR